MARGHPAQDGGAARRHRPHGQRRYARRPARLPAGGRAQGPRPGEPPPAHPARRRGRPRQDARDRHDPVRASPARARRADPHRHARGTSSSRCSTRCGRGSRCRSCGSTRSGIQRVRQKLPATRNPFTYFKRAIISIDTLKSDRYLAHLRKQRWDAVVIDESHNVTNSGTQNNRLARVLAPQTDALILASATPHNGKPESFAELIRLLDPTAVRPDGTVIEDEVRRLIIRRHRHSPEVASVVGADWAERKEPQQLCSSPPPTRRTRSPANSTHVWLHPESGISPYSGSASGLFPWILAKAFLSSPTALLEIDQRAHRPSGQVPHSRSRAGVRGAAAARSARPQARTTLVPASTPRLVELPAADRCRTEQPRAGGDLRRARRHAELAAGAPAGRPEADRQAGGDTARRPAPIPSSRASSTASSRDRRRSAFSSPGTWPLRA